MSTCKRRSPWFLAPTGVKCLHFEQDWDHTISREGCSLKITDRNHYDGYAGTAQTGFMYPEWKIRRICLDEVWAGGSCFIEIYDKEGREFLSKTISVNGEWKNTVLIDPLQLLYTGTMEIRLKAAGTLWVDGCSHAFWYGVTNMERSIWTD